MNIIQLWFSCHQPLIVFAPLYDNISPLLFMIISNGNLTETALCIFVLIIQCSTKIWVNYISWCIEIWRHWTTSVILYIALMRSVVSKSDVLILYWENEGYSLEWSFMQFQRMTSQVMMPDCIEPVLEICCKITLQYLLALCWMGDLFW